MVNYFKQTLFVDKDCKKKKQRERNKTLWKLNNFRNSDLVEFIGPLSMKRFPVHKFVVWTTFVYSLLIM